MLPTFYPGLPDRGLAADPAAPRRPASGRALGPGGWGTEIGTGYSELIDPAEQRARLTAQSLLAAGGDVEAM